LPPILAAIEEPQAPIAKTPVGRDIGLPIIGA
jgi:hypothetical protein